MTTETLVIRSFTEGQELARNLKQSALVPDALRGKEADILFIVLTGAEMGMGPMKSLQAFESIKGRVGMKPVYMLGMVRAHPSIKSIKLVTTPKGAVVTSQRKGEEDVLRTEFTMADAQTAGLTSSEMYRKWPAQMLGWRCVAIHCRTHHSDITGGHYTTEEVDSFDGPAERDVTPARPAADTSKPDGVEAMKRRMRVVDAATGADVRTPPPSPPALPGVEDPTTVGWGKNAAAKLSELSADKVQWYLDDAVKKATDNTDDERELWAGRAARYRAALARVTEVAS